MILSMITTDYPGYYPSPKPPVTKGAIIMTAIQTQVMMRGGVKERSKKRAGGQL
jgi:hypothetical protein